jgi:hypothetical protein
MMNSLVSFLSLDRLYVWSQFAVYIFGGIGLITGKLVNDRQAEELLKSRLELEQVKERQRPRLITQAEQNALTDTLSAFKNQRGTVIASPSTPESEWFARVLTAPLIAAGWDMKILPGTPVATVLYPTGIIIGYPIGQPTPEAAAKLADALNELGIAATAVPGVVVAPNTIEITISAK